VKTDNDKCKRHYNGRKYSNDFDSSFKKRSTLSYLVYEDLFFLVKFNRLVKLSTGSNLINVELYIIKVLKSLK